MPCTTAINAATCNLKHMNNIVEQEAQLSLKDRAMRRVN